jgi:hypothetical protein
MQRLMVNDAIIRPDYKTKKDLGRVGSAVLFSHFGLKPLQFGQVCDPIREGRDPLQQSQPVLP